VLIKYIQGIGKHLGLQSLLSRTEMGLDYILDYMGFGFPA